MSFCAELVRQNNYKNYLLSFFTPRSLRNDILAIMALDCEIQGIRLKTTEPVTGLIRLQWWRNNIEDIYRAQLTANSPVLSQINKIILKHGINKLYFDVYFNKIDDLIMQKSNDQIDISKLIHSILKTPEHINKFEKKKFLLERLNPNSPFLPLRLWLGK